MYLLSRRLLVLGLLGACGRVPAVLSTTEAVPEAGGGGGAPAPARAVARPSARVPAADSALAPWLAGFRARAAAQGIGEPLLDAALGRARYLPDVVKAATSQPEVRRSLEDNIALAASDARIRVGRAKLVEHRRLFDRIERRYRVEREMVCAIWGHESTYGARKGKTEIVSALASLASAGIRADFFERELIAALKIVQAGDVALDGLVGSWAGAMGHTQFIATSYLAHAVDFDGDGRRDIWGDDPTDALASAAAYLADAGWRHGEPWGVEVDAHGRRMDGRAAPDLPTVQLLQPLGEPGPRFRVYNNYKVIRRYNNSMAYAIGVGHLADRLAGGAPFVGPFPRDGEGLNLKERKEIQRRLRALGHAPGTLDGVIGDATMAAIRAFQRSAGLAVDGVATRALLQALRRAG